MGKKVAIIQSNYIPWKGYFDIIARADEFIIYDEVQYTKNDWRNRNKIKTTNGLLWLTIPVTVNHLHQKINETKVADKLWMIKHIKSIKNFYIKAKFYNEFQPYLLNIYNSLQEEEYLSKINYQFISEICKFLGIRTKISLSTDYNLGEGKTDRLVNLCKQSLASTYISGPSAKDYIDIALFEKAGIKVVWIDYSNYKEYNQLFPPFEHHVSILDLIFNEGVNARNYLNYVEKNE